MDINKIIKDLEEKLNAAKEKYANKKVQIGMADGPMESAGISLSRWILEDEISIAGREVKRLEEIIQELKSMKKVEIKKVMINGKEREFLITKTVEDFELGLIRIK
jgi:hypothetical protein